jgi:hypothetical protein
VDDSGKKYMFQEAQREREHAGGLLNRSREPHTF